MRDFDNPTIYTVMINREKRYNIIIAKDTEAEALAEVERINAGSMGRGYTAKYRGPAKKYRERK